MVLLWLWRAAVVNPCPRHIRATGPVATARRKPDAAFQKHFKLAAEERVQFLDLTDADDRRASHVGHDDGPICRALREGVEAARSRGAEGVR